MHFVITNNIVKVAVNPQANSRVDVQTSLTMLWGNSDVNFFNNKYQIMGLFTYRQWQLANGHAKITAVIVKSWMELLAWSGQIGLSQRIEFCQIIAFLQKQKFYNNNIHCGFY